MIWMYFKRKAPGRILGVGEFEPGKKYPLPDHIARGLIETKDPDWEQVAAGKDRISAPSSEIEEKDSKEKSDSNGSAPSKFSRRK
jgi:hypothetical protein